MSLSSPPMGAVPETVSTDPFARARLMADAVLYEGYILYPYRASAEKNRLRWQFGVVAPRDFAKADGSEDWSMQTECVLEPGPDVRLDVKVRFLRVQERRVERALDPDGAAFLPVESLELAGSLLTSWDEATEEELDLADLSLDELLSGEQSVPIELALSHHVETLRDDTGKVLGRVVRTRRAISAMLSVQARSDGPLVLVRVRVENLTPWCESNASRDDVVRQSLVAVHTLLALRNGAFVSLFDPPESARAAVASCTNTHTWPVLIGDEGQRDVVLSSPVTLYDYAEVAPESAGDFFDATEIDEMLALRVMTLTDDEKREARGTDARAAAIVDRCDDMPTEVFERLHGVVRYLRDVTGPTGETPGGPAEVPWWGPGADASVKPFEDKVWVGAVEVGRGSEVRLRPNRRADAQDLFLAGLTATVQAVLQDVDGDTHLAVSVGGDPADDLQQWHGRYLYFYPDEVEALEETS